MASRYHSISLKFCGGFGTPIMIAPPAADDSSESPKILDATSLAYTFSPIERSNGVPSRIERGTIQLVYATIVLSEPSQ